MIRFVSARGEAGALTEALSAETPLLADFAAMVPEAMAANGPRLLEVDLHGLGPLAGPKRWPDAEIAKRGKKAVLF